MNQIKFDDQFHTLISRCIRCGQCTYGDEEVGYEVLCPIYKQYKFFSYSPGGIVQIARAVYEKKIKASDDIRDIVYKCTTCGVCEEACGVVNASGRAVSPMKAAGLLKQELIKEGIDPPFPLNDMRNKILKNRSPFGNSHNERTSWISPQIREKFSSHPSLLYFVGCTSSYKEKEIAKSFTELLIKVGKDFTISPDEWCCGMPLYMSGRVDDLAAYVNHNVNLIHEMGVKTVVFTCPGCYYTFKVFYPEWLGEPLPFEVVHSTDFIEKNIDKKKVGFKIEEAIKVTYHDPCHLGRGTGIYDAPRRLLGAIDKIEMIEMKRTRQNSLCCGSGGGTVKAPYPDYSLNIAKERVLEAGETGADTLVTSCPACKRNLSDAVSELSLDLKVLDIVEALSIES